VVAKMNTGIKLLPKLQDLPLCDIRALRTLDQMDHFRAYMMANSPIGSQNWTNEMEVLIKKDQWLVISIHSSKGHGHTLIEFENACKDCLDNLYYSRNAETSNRQHIMFFQ
jgi:hypothetical protein